MFFAIKQGLGCVRGALIRGALIQGALILCISLPSSAATALLPPLRLTLADSIYIAMRQDPAVKTALIQRTVDRIHLDVAQWNYKPHYIFGATAGYTNSVTNGARAASDNQTLTPGVTLLTPVGTQFNLQLANPLSHTAGSARYYNPSATLTVTQPLLRGAGRDIAGAPLDQAALTEQGAQLSLQNTLMANITNVINGYITILQSQNQLAVQQLSLKDAMAILRQQQAQLHAGRVAPADIAQFSASVANQQLAIHQQQVALQQQVRTFLLLIGLNPDLPVELSSERAWLAKLLKDPLPSLALCQQQALAHNISYQQALLSLRSARIAQRVAHDAARWQLDASLSQTQGGGSGGAPNSSVESLVNGQNHNTSAQLTLNIPIDDMAIKQAMVSADVAVQQQQIALNQTQQQVNSEVTNAWQTLRSQKQQIVEAEKAVGYARISKLAAEAKLRTGKVSAFEVSTLQTTLIQQQTTLLSLRASWSINLAQLDQLTGQTLRRWHLQLNPDATEVERGIT